MEHEGRKEEDFKKSGKWGKLQVRCPSYCFGKNRLFRRSRLVSVTDITC